MFGAAPPHGSSFIQPFIKSMREGKELNKFSKFGILVAKVNKLLIG